MQEVSDWAVSINTKKDARTERTCFFGPVLGNSVGRGDDVMSRLEIKPNTQATSTLLGY